MNKFYATLCLREGNYYVAIEANDREEAREKMFASKYGAKWAFMYDETEKADCIDKYNTSEIDQL